MSFVERMWKDIFYSTIFRRSCIEGSFIQTRFHIKRQDRAKRDVPAKPSLLQCVKHLVYFLLLPMPMGAKALPAHRY